MYKRGPCLIGLHTLSKRLSRVTLEALLAIAAENNLSETAFLIPGENANMFQIRWFTPLTEAALCGHATLASGLVLFECRGVPGNRIVFQTRRSGQLIVSKNGDCYELDFPARRTESRPPPERLLESLGLTGAEVFATGEDVYPRNPAYSSAATRPLPQKLI